MWWEALYWIGMLSGVWCLYDLFMTKRTMAMPLKIVVAVVVLALSWVGIALYWLILRKRLK